MPILPIGSRVLVKPVAKSSSLIVVPDSMHEKPEQGEIVSLGETHPSLLEGDKILFKKYSPDEFKLEGETYLILSMDDILAVIK